MGLTDSEMSRFNTNLLGSGKGTQCERWAWREITRVSSSSLLPLHPVQIFYMNCTKRNTCKDKGSVRKDSHGEVRMRKLLFIDCKFGLRKQHFQPQHFQALIRINNDKMTLWLQPTKRKKDLTQFMVAEKSRDWKNAKPFNLELD